MRLEKKCSRCLISTSVVLENSILKTGFAASIALCVYDVR